MRLAATAVALSVCLLACTPGTPLGYSSGTSWSFPLVAPLEGGPLLVPVTIKGHGPYLFLVSPDSPYSAVDSAIVSELELRSLLGPHIGRGKRGHNVWTEVHHMTLGTLALDAVRVFVVTPVGRYNRGGHQIRGMLGSDVINSAVAFGFDRRAGMAWIATQRGFQPPADAVTIETHAGRVRGRLIAKQHYAGVTVDGRSKTLRLDLVGAESTLQRHTDGGRDRVEIGDTWLGDVAFGEDRSGRIDSDGTLGLAAFAGRAVAFNLDDGRLYLSPEQDTPVKARIDRWGNAALSACAVPACTTASLLVAEPPADPGAPVGRPVLAVTRTDEVAAIAVEVLVEARTREGAPADLPPFIAIFAEGETQLSSAIDTSYLGKTFEVVDVSPFPRACARRGGCIYQLATP
jgi:hypothetical protein